MQTQKCLWGATDSSDNVWRHLKKMMEGLERWLKSQEHLLLLQKTHVQFLAPTSVLTTICNSIPGYMAPISDLCMHQACTCYTYLYSGKTPKKKSEKKTEYLVLYNAIKLLWNSFTQSHAPIIMSCFTTGPETVEPRWPWTETSKVLNQNKPSLLLFKVFLPQWQEGNTFRILISEEKPHLRCLLIKYFFLDSLPMYARLALSQNISALQITSGCITLFFFFEFCTLSNTIYISHCEGLEKKKSV